MVTDNQFQYWPISSIALFALRKNILALSINTWYKYVNNLGLKRIRPTSRRKTKAVSVRAECPHQIWHADITVFVTADKVKHYIYVVIDNYSRKIISWLIADSVKAVYRKITIEMALKNVKQNHPLITLITDGGPENKLQTFLNSLDHRVQHNVALLDVHYSNSLIEAFFKTGKYNYLYRMDIRDGKDLKKAFEFIVQDYNDRPHISLHGLTPNEGEMNMTLDKEQLHAYIESVTQQRKDYNQANRCTQCKE
jgi:putative transposase